MVTTVEKEMDETRGWPAWVASYRFSLHVKSVMLPVILQQVMKIDVCFECPEEQVKTILAGFVQELKRSGNISNIQRLGLCRC